MDQTFTSTGTPLGRARDFDVRRDGTWVGLFQRADRVHIASSDGRSFPLRHDLGSPILRFLERDRVIAMDRRSSPGQLAAYLFTLDGDEEAAFSPGDGVCDVVPLGDRIAVTYFDEGVFGDSSPSCQGLAFFDSRGELVGGYRDLFGSEAVEIADCYCACRVDRDQLAFSSYLNFPLVLLDPRTRAHTALSLPETLHGAHALSIRGDDALLFSPYRHRGAILRWRPGDDPLVIGRHDGILRGLDDGRFLSVEDHGFTVLSLGSSG